MSKDITQSHKVVLFFPPCQKMWFRLGMWSTHDQNNSVGSFQMKVG